MAEATKSTKIDNVSRQTKLMLDAALDARMPTMIVGPPGTGKSATVKSIARERGYELITLVGSRMDPTDVSGLPKSASVEIVDDSGETRTVEATVYLAPFWQVQILQKRRVILFLDEYSNSSGAIQAAFLTILQDREFPNGEKFPEETIVIGASNPSDEAADGYEMALPTTNRMFWISWNPTIEAWVKGMKNAFGEEVPDDELKWKQKIATFVNENQKWIHQLPIDAPTTQAYGLNPNSSSDMEVFRSAWPSRRSWDNLSRVLAKSPEEVFVQDSIAQGIVGYAAAAAFRDWLRKNESINPLDVLADPEAIDWGSISTNDVTLVLRSIVDMVKEENALQALNVFRVIAEQGYAGKASPYIKDLFGKVMGGDGVVMSAAAKAANRKACTELIPIYEKVTKQAK